jgi:hypothetical protein
MKKIASIVLAFGVAAGAAQAQAASARMSDTEYLQAVRCRGLAAAQGIDTAQIDAELKTQKHGRHSYIAERASDTARAARRAAGSGSAAMKAQISAEMQGACQAYFGETQALALRN